MTHNIFTEDGRTRFRNFMVRLRSYLILFFFLGAVSGAAAWWVWTWGEFRPLERMYFRSFLVASIKSKLPIRTHGKYTVLAYAVAGGRFGILNDDQVYVVRNEEGRAIRSGIGYLFRGYEGVKLPPFQWQRVRVFDSDAERLFREVVYRDSFLGLFASALFVCVGVMLTLTTLTLVFDRRVNRRYEAGKRVRGSRLVHPKEYERENKKADGLALVVKAMTPEKGIKRLYGWVMGDDDPTYLLRMKRSEEAQGALILGDIGSGKSQLMHGLLAQLAKRGNEAVIVYDPACEFVKAHYNTRRGDVILNPLDARAPFWSPAFECRDRTDYLTVADSFFPGKGERSNMSEQFFNQAARDIFAHILEIHSDPAQLVAVLADAEAIDKLCDGTELAHYIAKKAANQRSGVLGTLAKVGKTLRMLPAKEDCEFDFSLTEWTRERRGWIFLTSTKETEERLRPLYVAYLDLLMRRLLSVDESIGQARPITMMVDEVHSLGYLPTLYKAIVEGRKFSLKVFHGSQNKNQYDARYGDDAPTMLSCSRHTIILRCKEPQSAKWLADLIGGEESEKPRTGVTASVADQGRDSMNYATYTEHRAVVSKEEIASLPDLCGYWKYSEKVVPFRFDYIQWPVVAERFKARRSAPARMPEPEAVPDIPAAVSVAEPEHAVEIEQGSEDEGYTKGF